MPIVRMLGSSPRGRGKPHGNRPDAGRARLIPARAGKTCPTNPLIPAARAHPRAGGENEAHCLVPSGVYGSSPRGRGKHAGVGEHPAAWGLIPARAGKTRTSAALFPCSAAHPRAGGENHVFDVGWREYSGSSPRGRGKRSRRTDTPPRLRLIPARAGKTRRGSDSHSSTRAHPRAGGENLTGLAATPLTLGSSPRGRGKPRTHGAHARADGLIPARAGKTARVIWSVMSCPAHPRAGGENSASALAFSRPHGSSPRGRGKLKGKNVEADVARLIPARAGKTLRGDPHLRDATAHPRAGGENQDENIVNLSKQGSSPRGRGKRCPATAIRRDRRLIPARAGKTGPLCAATSSVAAHPRAGGENMRAVPGIWIDGGSSPRGRGKLWPVGQVISIDRLIPARAGKTNRQNRPCR